jgi:hypothetical protein
MKKLITAFGFLAILSISQTAIAGNGIFKPFKIIASLGYLMPKNVEYKYPLDFQLEPKVALSDNFWLGLRLESAIMVQRSIFEDDYKALGVFSIVPFFDYSIVASKKFRPFLGMGYGTYTSYLFFDGPDMAKTSTTLTKTGFCPRIGFEYKTFNISLEHNFVKGGVEYSAIKAGFTIGGGLKRGED